MSAGDKSEDELEEELMAELINILQNPHAESFDGVVAVGGRMKPELLRLAYRHGIFPWPHEGYPLLWFSPDERGVIDVADFHLPRSFKRWLKKCEALYEITYDRHFSEVVEHCARQKRRGQSGTWITSEIKEQYARLFSAGGAFSVEVSREGRLVGGLYGVKSEAYWSCESMFHLEDNVSKLALKATLERVREKGMGWLDIQMVTEVCALFGGRLISRTEFLERLGF
jgi:leucyl/phenylalanyl-tRNA--protein transferase